MASGPRFFKAYSYILAVNCLYVNVNCDWWLPLDGGGVPGGVEDG